MFLRAFLSCILVHASFAASDDVSITGMVRPRSLSIEAYEEKIRQFWTPDKFAAAKSMDVVLPKSSGKAISANNPVPNGPPSRIAGSYPQLNETRGRAIPKKNRHIYTTGKVFWDMGDYSYGTCSAAIVKSQSYDLIVTAAHCVYDTDTHQWYNNNNWVFVPAYSFDNRPYGTWPARSFILRNAWMYSTDYNSDVAFVALSTLNGRHIAQNLGAQGIAFNQRRLAYTYSLGYPSNLDSGLLLRYCRGYAKRSQYTGNNFIGQGLSCNMGKGCSGGPWLQYFKKKTGFGYVTSVNSFTITGLPNVMNGPYFETNIKSLYDSATSM